MACWLLLVVCCQDNAALSKMRRPRPLFGGTVRGSSGKVLHTAVEHMSIQQLDSKCPASSRFRTCTTCPTLLRVPNMVKSPMHCNTAPLWKSLGDAEAMQQEFKGRQACSCCNLLCRACHCNKYRRYISSLREVDDLLSPVRCTTMLDIYPFQHGGLGW